jgi:phosphopantothenoylcysteine decarboxylase / phosphopantothenate---cysteine ligase
LVAILVTAGPTREYLDDVRFLANGSSGRMGLAIAAAAAAAGHRVTMVLGPVELPPPPGVDVVPVVSALDMQAAAASRFDACDVLIAAAAVADYRPAARLPGKPAKGASLRLELVPNPDIVAGLAARKGGRVVVGFALESAATAEAEALARAREKLQRKGLDLVVCNSSAVIGSDQGEAVLLWADGRRSQLGRASKAGLAEQIVAAAVQLWQDRHRR